MALLDGPALERSTVVANCTMNRERDLLGSNGYARELKFNPLDLLISTAQAVGQASWLDMCCGSGRALAQAAATLAEQELADRVSIVGVDLVGAFVHSDRHESLRWIQASLSTWKPDRRFDLITCVHGLHYIGDKLQLIRKAAGWLTPSGRFVANFDSKSIKLEDGKHADRLLTRLLREAGVAYQSRAKLLIVDGNTALRFPLEFIGADDQAGPNYTGQPAVDAYYRRTDGSPGFGGGTATTTS